MINVTYQLILHETAIRMSALVGTNVTSISAAYDTVNLTAVHFKSADWPFGAFRDSILAAVGEFAWAIADTEKHVWRQYFAAETNALANGDGLPGLASNGREIIGKWGNVYDIVDGKPLEPHPRDIVRRLSEETWRLRRPYYYCIDGLRILHTRPNSVKIQCCAYSRTLQRTAFDANSEWGLPDVLEMPVVSRAISTMTKDGAWESQAAIYRGYSDDALTAIRAGSIVMPDTKLL